MYDAVGADGVGVSVGITVGRGGEQREGEKKKKKKGFILSRDIKHIGLQPSCLYRLSWSTGMSSLIIHNM